MQLPVSYFQYNKFSFDIKTFIPFWTEIQTMMKKSFADGCTKESLNILLFFDLFDLFDLEFEKIKQKKFYEFTTPKDEATILREIIYKFVTSFYKKTPIDIIKDFYITIKDDCFQGGYGHIITINHPIENPLYDNFYKYICNFDYESWPHHYKLSPKIYESLKTVPIEVYFALLSINSYMLIDDEPSNTYWGE